MFNTPIADSNLSVLDKIIETLPPSNKFMTLARRIRKQSERFTSAARDYWKSTIKDRSWQKPAPIPTTNSWTVPVPPSKSSPISAPKHQQFQMNLIIKKVQVDVKALASKFQTSHSVHQKETKNSIRQSLFSRNKAAQHTKYLLPKGKYYDIQNSAARIANDSTRSRLT